MNRISVENDNLRIQQMSVYFQSFVNKFDELKNMIYLQNENGYIHSYAMSEFERIISEFDEISTKSIKEVFEIRQESDRDLRDCKQALYEENFDADMYLNNKNNGGN